MRLKQDAECRELRQISDERRLSFARGLKVGDVIGVWAGGEGDVDHTFFLASSSAAEKHCECNGWRQPSAF